MKRPILFLFSLAVVTMADERNWDKILINSDNTFTAKMFTEVVKSKPEESIVFSAFSVLPPLAQLALASVGESHDEILATIGMPNDNVTKAVFLKANNDLKSVKGVTLKMASKIYIAEKYEINKDFGVVSRDVFGSEVANIDFSEKERAAKKINQWVEAQTNNRIKNLVDPSNLSGGVRALLVNAIYFKGLWKTCFDKEKTEDRDFHVNKEYFVKVPTMYKSDTFNYTESEELDAQVLELAYKGGDSALYVILPQEIDGINQLKRKFRDPSLLDNVISNMYESKVEVYLPKFKIETTIDLKEVLINMNVKKIFTRNEARLNNLLETAGDLYINDAKQKAFIEINEEGSEAAAGNVIGIFLSSLVIPPTPKFAANRPFIFVVKENKLTLFSGVYYGN